MSWMVAWLPRAPTIAAREGRARAMSSRCSVSTVCVTRSVLPRLEGRDEMYSWMVSDLERALEIVVYDFACSLHEFA